MTVYKFSILCISIVKSKSKWLIGDAYEKGLWLKGSGFDYGLYQYAAHFCNRKVSAIAFICISVRS